MDPAGVAQTAAFYDSLAPTYDRLFADWDASSARHGTVVRDLVSRFYPNCVDNSPDGARTSSVPTCGMRVLDCACGIGTQALGMAAAGFRVTATDLSRAAVERARVEAAKRGLLRLDTSSEVDGARDAPGKASGSTAGAGADSDEGADAARAAGVRAGASAGAGAGAGAGASGGTAGSAPSTDAGAVVGLGVADFRRLHEALDAQSLLPHTEERGFPVVVALDNALPHLLSDDDILQALTSMKRCLSPGGVLMLSTRDYDELAKTKPPGTMPYRSKGGSGYGFQVWDWRTLPSGADVYDVQLFVLHPADSTPAASGVAGEGSAAPEAGQGDAWHAQRHRAVYRALRRAELSLLLRRAGFGTVRWLLPAESGFFQPVVVASVAADLPHQL